MTVRVTVSNDDPNGSPHALLVRVVEKDTGANPATVTLNPGDERTFTLWGSRRLTVDETPIPTT